MSPTLIKSSAGIRLCWVLAAGFAVMWGYSLSKVPMMVNGNQRRLTLELADGIVAASWPSAAPVTASSSIVHVHDTYYVVPRGITSPRTFGFILPSYSSSLPIFTPALSFVFVPIWLPMLLALIAPAVSILRRRRRVPEGHCRHCRYDLTGNTSGVCPECGLTVTVNHSDSGRLLP